MNSVQINRLIMLSVVWQGSYVVSLTVSTSLKQDWRHINHISTSRHRTVLPDYQHLHSTAGKTPCRKPCYYVKPRPKDSRLLKQHVENHVLCQIQTEEFYTTQCLKFYTTCLAPLVYNLENQQIGTMQAVKFKLEIWQSRVVQRFYKHIMQVSFETSVVKGQLELIRQRLEDPPTYPYQLTFPLPLSPCTLFPTSLHTVFSY